MYLKSGDWFFSFRLEIMVGEEGYKMHAYVEILIRTVLAILMLLLIAKILGKQTISNMTFHDFVTGITVGAIAANLAFNEKLNWSYLILSLVVISITSLLLSVIALKSRKMRNWISGSPTVLIEDGKILEDNMRKVSIRWIHWIKP